jgi:hypothetical protein
MNPPVLSEDQAEESDQEETDCELNPIEMVRMAWRMVSSSRLQLIFMVGSHSTGGGAREGTGRFTR